MMNDWEEMMSVSVSFLLTAVVTGVMLPSTFRHPCHACSTSCVYQQSSLLEPYLSAFCRAMISDKCLITIFRALFQACARAYASAAHCVRAAAESVDVGGNGCGGYG